MNDLTITNARIVTRDDVFTGDLVVRAGRIAGLGPSGRPSAAVDAIDFGGDFLLPGRLLVEDIDAYRTLYPEHEGEGYTWWSNRGNAWANNVGWRIDYQVISPSLKPRLLSASVYKASRFSDHSPLIVDYAD